MMKNFPPIDRGLLPLHDQAAGILYCIGRQLFQNAGLDDKRRHGDEAFKQWRELRTLADYFMLQKSTWIPPNRRETAPVALNFAHALEHVRWDRGEVYPVERCTCPAAKLIRELAAVRNKASFAEIGAGAGTGAQA
jgi:hypothetical protein